MFVRDMPQLCLKMRRIKKGEKSSKKSSADGNEEDGSRAEADKIDGQNEANSGASAPMMTQPPAVAGTTNHLPFGLQGLTFPGQGQGISGFPGNLQLQGQQGNAISLPGLPNATMPGLPNQLIGLQGLVGQASGLQNLQGFQIPGLQNLTVQNPGMQSFAGQLPAGLQSLFGQAPIATGAANQLHGLSSPGQFGLQQQTSGVGPEVGSSGGDRTSAQAQGAPGEAQHGKASSASQQVNAPGVMPPLPGILASAPGVDSVTLMKLQEALTAAGGGSFFQQQLQQQPQQQSDSSQAFAPLLGMQNNLDLSQLSGQNGNILAAQLQAAMQPSSQSNPLANQDDKQEREEASRPTAVLNN